MCYKDFALVLVLIGKLSEIMKQINYLIVGNQYNIAVDGSFEHFLEQYPKPSYKVFF